MATSNPAYLTPVCQKIAELPKDINRVVDIGVGTGKWGVLLREFLETRNGRFYEKDWKTCVLGIEIHAEYKSRLWDAYDNVFIGDMCDLFPTMGKFDLVMFLGTLEHVDKERGQALLRQIHANSRYTIFNYHNAEQGQVGNNPKEAHVSKWSHDDFVDLPVELLAEQKDLWGLYFMKS